MDNTAPGPKPKKRKETKPLTGTKAADQQLLSAMENAGGGLKQLAKARKDEAAAEQTKANALETQADAQLLAAQNHSHSHSFISPTRQTLRPSPCKNRSQRAGSLVAAGGLGVQGLLLVKKCTCVNIWPGVQQLPAGFWLSAGRGVITADFFSQTRCHPRAGTPLHPRA